MREATEIRFQRDELDLAVVVPDDQFVAIVGENGVGKTTVLRCLAGLEPSSIVVWAPGTEPASIGYLPQRISLYPAMSLQDNVASSLRFRGVHRADALRRAGELLELVDISGLARRRPHEVSGGQRQRAGLARAIASTPSMLLLDEPFSAVDIASREMVRHRVIEHIKNSGSRCVIATHDQSDVDASGAVAVEII